MSESPPRQTRKARHKPIAADSQTVTNDISFPDRRHQEVLRYLKLFGYKPERTILQVHIAGFFNRKNSGSREGQKRREASNKRYGGTTFIVVGRSHDPAIMDQLLKPKTKPDKASPGYLGYLWKNKDPQQRDPHEILPLDFTPINISYPPEWKNMFATKGFMVAMHVPSDFARHKNKLTRALYHVGKNADVRKEWTFLNDLEKYGYASIVIEEEPQRREESPADLLKMRLARGEISSIEYEKLWKSLAA